MNWPLMLSFGRRDSFNSTPIILELLFNHDLAIEAHRRLRRQQEFEQKGNESKGVASEERNRLLDEMNRGEE